MIDFNNRKLVDMYSNGRRLFKVALGERTIWHYRINQVRYIRDTLSGSNVNTDNHWIEIAVNDLSGRNVAQGITPTVSSGAIVVGTRHLSWITDGVTTNHDRYYGTDSNRGPRVTSVTIDLGEVKDISTIQVWHYWRDNRQYASKLEVSRNGVDWFKVFDSISQPSLKYRETAQGKIHDLAALSQQFM